MALERATQRHVLVRGLRNGALVALVLFGVAAVVVALLLNGRGVADGGVFAFGEAAVIGISVGLSVAVGYLLIGLALVGIGILFRAKAGWVTAGAWAAVPVIVAGAGFGYVSFRSVQTEASQPQNVSGTASLSLSGTRIGNVTAQAEAQCALDRLGGVAVDSSGIASEGRAFRLSFSVAGGGGNASIALTIAGVSAGPGKGWEPGPQTMVVQPGSSRSSGTVTLMNIVPLTDQSQPDPTERWSGQFSWTCNA